MGALEMRRDTEQMALPEVWGREPGAEGKG